MRRRDLITMLGGAAAWTRAARAQAPPIIGYLGPEAPGPFASRVGAFREGLAERGYVEGRNVAIEFRWAQGDYRRLPELAADLARRRVDVLVAPGGAQVALAAKRATASIPVVFEMGGDPVAVGVVASLSQPEGNVTGVSSLSVEVSRKRLEFLHEILPGAAAFGVVANPASPTAPAQLRSLDDAAGRLGLRLQVVNADTEPALDAAFEASAPSGWGGLVFTSDPYFANRSGRLAAAAVAHAVPAVTQSRDFPMAGGLMSYGGDFTQSHRLAGVYAGRILGGERPGALPVQQVTKVELLVNLRAAALLGIAVPPTLASNADVVIE